MNNDCYDSRLHDVWAAEIDILDAVDAICRKHELRYSIAYGTMLGAVRHRGFIPWDDDVDIIMPREDYEQLIKLWDIEKPIGFILQNKFTNWDFTQNFTKIRKDHTTFIHNEWEKHVSYHTGIFIDIFPGDRVAPGKVSRKLQLFASAINLLYSRGYTSKSSGIRDVVERLFLCLPDRIKKSLYKTTNTYIQKYNGLERQPFFFPNTMEWAYRQYPEDMFDGLKDVDFAGHQYMCVSDTDKILTLDYGDYMTLPPIEDRVLKHHPMIMDTEHNLNEII